MSMQNKEKINQVYIDFKSKISNIKNRKQSLLKKYRAKLEEVKIKELQKSIKS